MPKIVTRKDRVSAIRTSAAALRDSINEAIAAEAVWGQSDPRTLSAWENVENHGATVHRNGRLMAGKKRGG